MQQKALAKVLSAAKVRKTKEQKGGGGMDSTKGNVIFKRFLAVILIFLALFLFLVLFKSDVGTVTDYAGAVLV